MLIHCSHLFTCAQVFSCPQGELTDGGLLEILQHEFGALWPALLKQWHAPTPPQTQGELTDGGLFEIFQHEFGMPGSKRFETARLNFLKSCAGWGRGGQAGGRKTMGLLSTYYSS